MKLHIDCDTPEVRKAYADARHIFALRTSEILWRSLDEGEQYRRGTERRCRKAGTRWAGIVAGPYRNWLVEDAMLVIDTDALREGDTVHSVLREFLTKPHELSDNAFASLIHEQRSRDKYHFAMIACREPHLDRFLEDFETFVDRLVEAISFVIIEALANALRYMKK